MLPLNKVDSRTALHHRGGQRYLDRVASSRREAMAKYFVTGATGFIGGSRIPRVVGAWERGVAVARHPGVAKDPGSLRGAGRPGGSTGPDFLRPPQVRGERGVHPPGR